MFSYTLCVVRALLGCRVCSIVSSRVGLERLDMLTLHKDLRCCNMGCYR